MYHCDIYHTLQGDISYFPLLIIFLHEAMIEELRNEIMCYLFLTQCKVLSQINCICMIFSLLN